MTRDEGRDRSFAGPPSSGVDLPPSVLDLVGKRTGVAPRVMLRDEDSATVASPVIDPSSKEVASIPLGRSNYQFLGEIARGGMGVILKGHDTDLGRDVAVKVLDARLSDHPEVVQRFIEEAQIGGQLQHPGIVPVYELGTMKDERPFFIMKLVKGRTLATLLAERESPAADTRRMVDIFEAVCQTMAYAHSRGVIHRDLKPANIMVGAFGEVQVVDWGLAKVLARGGTADEKRARQAQVQSQFTVLETVRSKEGSGSGSDSMVGSVMGTPAYMPPEQASGHVDRLDERADVFALGAILCETLTGLPPYTGTRDEIVAAAAQAECEPALKRLEVCGADPELLKLTKQCLMPAAAARPANAGVVAERVHHYIVSVEERAQAARVESAAALMRVEQERKARRLTAALAVAVVAILLVAGASWAFVQSERTAREHEQAAREREVAERNAKLSTEVGDALAEASVHEGGGRWDEALLSAERASALAQGGGAGSDLLDRVNGVVSRLQAARDLARVAAARDEDNRQLVAELLEAREPIWADNRDDPARAEASFEAVFRMHGIDIDAGTPQDVASLLVARGLGSEIALFLDSLTALRRQTGDTAGTDRALDVAHAVDPDPLRADLREALAARELGILNDIVASGFRDQPPITIELLGAALQQLGQREAARGVYRAGIDRFPGDFSLQYRLGRLLTPPELTTGPRDEMDEAAECYRAALALRPDSTVVRYYLGRIFFKLDRSERAIEQYLVALQQRPDDGTFLFNLAASRFKLGEVEPALETFRTLVDRKDPDWLEGWSAHLIGKCLLALGRPGEAIVAAERAVRVLPGQAPLVGGLLDAVFAGGTVEQQRRVIDDTLAQFPVDSNMLDNVAWSLAKSKDAALHDTGEAIALARRSIELNDAFSAWNTLGVALYYAGDFAGAIDAMQRSVRMQGAGSISDWLFLAMAHKRLGHDTEAQVWYDRSVDWMAGQVGIDPDTARFRAEADALLAP